MVDAALSYFVDAEMDKVTAKTQKLSRYLMSLLSTLPNVEILNSKSKYTGHVVIRIKGHAVSTLQLQTALMEKEYVFCDYAARYDLIRFGVGAIYTSHLEIHALFEKIKKILGSERPKL